MRLRKRRGLPRQGPTWPKPSTPSLPAAPWSTRTASARAISACATAGSRRSARSTRPSAGEVVDCTGLHILPGVIDTQVHFREPGAEHKEDLRDRVAVGGDGRRHRRLRDAEHQPADRPAKRRLPTRCAAPPAACIATSPSSSAAPTAMSRMFPSWSGCRARPASRSSWARRPATCWSPTTTGLRAILSRTRRRVSVHAEDEPRLIDRKGHRGDGRSGLPSGLARRDSGAARHRAAGAHRAADRRAGPSPPRLDRGGDELYRRLQGQRLGRADAAAPDFPRRTLRRARHTAADEPADPREPVIRARLWWGLQQGIADVLGSDHAPHTLEEKAKPYPASPSGMPGVQTLVPVMLDHVAAGRLSLERFVDLTSAGPARLFGIAGKGRIAVGYDADLTIVDLKRRETITDGWIASRAGWTPYDGMTVTGWPVGTVVRGRRVMWEGELVTPSAGAAGPLRRSAAARCRRATSRSEPLNRRRGNSATCRQGRARRDRRDRRRRSSCPRSRRDRRS